MKISMMHTYCSCCRLNKKERKKEKEKERVNVDWPCFCFLIPLCIIYHRRTVRAVRFVGMISFSTYPILFYRILYAIHSICFFPFPGISIYLLRQTEPLSSVTSRSDVWYLQSPSRDSRKESGSHMTRSTDRTESCGRASSVGWGWYLRLTQRGNFVLYLYPSPRRYVGGIPASLDPR